SRRPSPRTGSRSPSIACATRTSGRPEAAARASPHPLRLDRPARRPRLTRMDNARDLELLVASHHPIVSIESAEEERVEALLAEVAVRLDLPLFTWRATRGLIRVGTHDPIYE